MKKTLKKENSQEKGEKKWCDCGDEIDFEGRNGKCWVCVDQEEFNNSSKYL